MPNPQVPNFLGNVKILSQFEDLKPKKEKGGRIFRALGLHGLPLQWLKQKLICSLKR